MPVLKTRIHELRKERKMQQSDLAELVGVRRGNHRQSGKTEKYNPSLKLAMDIAKVFGKPVEYIFQFEEEDK